MANPPKSAYREKGKAGSYKRTPKLAVSQTQKDSLEAQLKNKDIVIDEFFPEGFREYIFKVPALYLGRSEEELLEDLIANYFYKPPILVETLRTNFWLEYDRVLENGGPFNIEKVYAGACTKAIFYEKLENWKHVAWILCKPLIYLQHVEALMSIGLRRVHELFKKPMIDPNTGEMDYKQAALVLKAVTMLDQRLKGGYVQKNLNIEKKTISFENAPAGAIEDIDERIRQLEKEATMLSAQTEPTGLVGLDKALSVKTEPPQHLEAQYTIKDDNGDQSGGQT